MNDFKITNKKKILIISPQALPIPAVCGGAVETLLTNFIEQNELKCLAELYVISIFNTEAAKFKYSNAHIIYQKNNYFGQFFYSLWLLLKRIVFKIFKLKKSALSPINYFGYKCYKIASRIKPDYIIDESYDRIHHLKSLLKIVDKDKFFYHLHYVRKSNPEIRCFFPNTIAISKYVLNEWTNNNIGEKDFVLYNGIDITDFQKNISSVEKNYFRKKYGFSTNDFIVLFTGRLRPHKGVLQLLQAFNMICHKDIKLLIAGDFLSESDNTNNSEKAFEYDCLKLIAMNSNIKRLGMIHYEQVNELYHLSDIQIVPSMWEEGAGLVVIEGMASGLPLIITKSGGMPEYTGEDCAIILERNNDLIGNICASILKLYSDSELRKKMSEIGRKRSKLFTKEDYYDNFMRIILNK